MNDKQRIEKIVYLQKSDLTRIQKWFLNELLELSSNKISSIDFDLENFSNVLTDLSKFGIKGGLISELNTYSDQYRFYQHYANDTEKLVVDFLDRDDYEPDEYKQSSDRTRVSTFIERKISITIYQLCRWISNETDIEIF